MASFEFLALILTGLGLTASIVYYANILRNANKTQQMQLFMQFYSKLTDHNFHDEHTRIRNRTWNDLDDYVEKYGTGPNLLDVYLEGIGLLVKRKEIDIQFVDDLMSGIILDYWGSHREIILAFRERIGQPQIGEWTEFLAGEIQRVAIKEHPELGKDAIPTYHKTNP